jgi:hypothetical protein
VKPCVPREPPSSRERRDGGSEPPGGRSPPPAADRAAPRRASLTLGAAGAWWPSWSSKPVRRCNPPLGRFDSGAAPSYLWPQNQPHRSRLVDPSRLVSGATRSENTCRLGAWDHRTTIAHGCFLRLSRAMCVEMATRRARKEVASEAPNRMPRGGASAPLAPLSSACAAACSCSPSYQAQVWSPRSGRSGSRLSRSSGRASPHRPTLFEIVFNVRIATNRGTRRLKDQRSKKPPPRPPEVLIVEAVARASGGRVVGAGSYLP